MNIIESIGKTPLIELEKLTSGCGARVFLKSEFFNPLASVKDRIGAAMIEAAERNGDSESRQCGHRTNFRKYGYCFGFRLCSKRVSLHSDDA